MKNNLKIVFFGTPNFAVPVLRLLIESGYNISAVFAGHGPVSVLAQELKIKVFQPTSLKRDEQVFEEFKNLKPDICIVAAYGKILPQQYLEVPNYGFLNIHPSLLPKYRGPSPIQTSILNGDKETGVTIMVVDEEVDHGPVLAEEKYYINENKGLIEISNELFGLGAALLVKTLPGYINGEIKPTEQNHSQATFTKMFQREGGKINWNEPAEKTYNQIRALNPEPGTWTTWKERIINIKKAEFLDGKIHIQIIQMEGGKEMSLEEFLHGHPDFDISQLT
ncbi:MAG: Methionyl-tRNA formyltransferase [Candidatus Yanofskybacteria bacterium GW2011_GWA1_41_6]|uniref:Methionyl-tRNA formyltransferase n=1 Tax=Candidatus Yanofskybacteria bacterium GW2011_GWA1_41_6 TaxID=1619020 RepID=A0A0G0ZL95_9BACT|nr:MAG: Methionyl-tRNA formyltransferase [Candidatus Yanofskybacteria bacterium GW2011_GWA1_41_6]